MAASLSKVLGTSVTAVAGTREVRPSRGILSAIWQPDLQAIQLFSFPSYPLCFNRPEPRGSTQSGPLPPSILGIIYFLFLNRRAEKIHRPPLPVNGSESSPVIFREFSENSNVPFRSGVLRTFYPPVRFVAASGSPSTLSDYGSSSILIFYRRRPLATDRLAIEQTTRRKIRGLPEDEGYFYERRATRARARRGIKRVWKFGRCRRFIKRAAGVIYLYRYCPES